MMRFLKKLLRGIVYIWVVVSAIYFISCIPVGIYRGSWEIVLTSMLCLFVTLWGASDVLGRLKE